MGEHQINAQHKDDPDANLALKQSQIVFAKDDPSLKPINVKGHYLILPNTPKILLTMF